MDLLGLIHNQDNCDLMSVINNNLYLFLKNIILYIPVWYVTEAAEGK